MRIPQLAGKPVEAARVGVQVALAEPDPRLAPQAYYERHRRQHLSNLRQFLRLEVDQRSQVLDLLSREAAMLLAQSDPEKIRQGVTMLDTVVAWERLSQVAA